MSECRLTSSNPYCIMLFFCLLNIFPSNAKRPTVFLLITGVAILIYYWYQLKKYSVAGVLGISSSRDVPTFYNLTFDTDTWIGLDSETSTGDQTCPKPHIYFVKVHKTGSSTFQSIIFRLGIKRDLDFVLFKCKYGFSYPHHAEKSYMYPDPTHGRFQGYHMIASHTRFHPDKYKSFMSIDTKVVTLIRHPFKQLISAFGFFNIAKQFMIKTNDPIKEFLNNPKKYDRKIFSFASECLPKIPVSYTKNPQYSHLSPEYKDEPSEQDIDSFLKLMDDNFSLVLILERLEESLLLFKKLFCLTTHDVLHLHQYNAKATRLKISNASTDDLIGKHRQWSKVDYRLYEHFSSKLDKMVEDLGNEFQSELKEFRLVINKVTNFCKESCQSFSNLRSQQSVKYVKNVMSSEHIMIPASEWESSFNVTRGDCALMMFEAMEYNQALKARQYPTSCQGRSVNNKTNLHKGVMPVFDRNYCDKNQHFLPNFPWSKFKKSKYFDRKFCLKNL